MTTKHTQADWVTEELGTVPEYDIIKDRHPGIENLHKQTLENMGEIIGQIIKSQPIVMGLYISRVVEGSKVREKVAPADMKILHQKSTIEQGETLAQIWKSKPNVVGLRYIPGSYIELETSEGKAGDTTVEVTVERLNK